MLFDEASCIDVSSQASRVKLRVAKRTHHVPRASRRAATEGISLLSAYIPVFRFDLVHPVEQMRPQNGDWSNVRVLIDLHEAGQDEEILDQLHQQIRRLVVQGNASTPANFPMEERRRPAPRAS